MYHRDLLHTGDNLPAYHAILSVSYLRIAALRLLARGLEPQTKFVDRPKQPRTSRLPPTLVLYSLTTSGN